MSRLRTLLCVLLCLFFCFSAHAELYQVDSPDAMPEADADGFLSSSGDGYYYSNHSEGLWLYMDADTRIEITRHQTKSPLITYYLADIVCRPGTTMYTRTWNEKSRAAPMAFPRRLRCGITPSLP